MIDKQKRIFAWALFYLLIFSFFLYNSFDYLDTDFGWHIKIGEEISSQRQAPDIENRLYPLLGQPWVDHEWLSNLLLFLFYNNFGYAALNVLFGLLLITILIMLNFFTRSYSEESRDFNKAFFSSEILMMFFLFWGVTAMSPHLGVRVQQIALLFVLLLLLIINGYNRSKNKKILFFLPLLFLIWANLHGSFLIGFFIIGLWPAVKIFERVWAKYKTGGIFEFRLLFPPAQIFNFIIFAFASLAATFATPYGPKMYSFLKDYGDNFYMQKIAEWLPPYFFPIQYNQLLYLAVFLSLAGLNFYIYHKEKKSLEPKKSRTVKFDVFTFALSMFFLILSMKSKRHFPLFFIVSFPLFLSLAVRRINPIFKKTVALLAGSRIVKAYFVLALVLAAAALGLKTNFTNSPFTNEKFCGFYPCQAVSYIKNDPRYADLKLFNNYGWGGWLGWVWPEKKLFIDGRLPQYKLGGRTYLEEYYEFFQPDKAAVLLAEYEIKLVLMAKEEKAKLNWYEKSVLGQNEEAINSRPDYFKNYLSGAADWLLIYEDETSYVYAR